MRRAAKNPFVDCDAAIEALLEMLTPDLGVQKRIAEAQIRSLLGEKLSYFDDDDLLELIDLLQTRSSLNDMRRILQEYAPLGMMWWQSTVHVWPAFFLMGNPQFVKDVKFVHWTNAEDDIAFQGFRGRVTPSKLTATRVVADFEVVGNGYIFAYPLHVGDDPYATVLGDTDLGASFSARIDGVASQALRFNASWDAGEEQLIVPVKCIQPDIIITPTEGMWDLSEFLLDDL